MNERIVYQEEGKAVCVLIPCKCGLSIQQIGEKDVPSGIDFWIIDKSNVPQDRSARNFWDLDLESLGESAGQGTRVVRNTEGESDD